MAIKLLFGVFPKLKNTLILLPFALERNVGVIDPWDV
jgi:hypothetical protein